MPDQTSSPNPIVLVMGVSGVGKTAVGQALAAELDALFLDADDFHPPANIARMASGQPLNDADRAGWLDRLHATLLTHARANRSLVLACSALRQAYRERLTAGLDGRVCVVFLQADYDTIRERMEARAHFMPPTLLRSQFETLETPGNAITIDASRSLAEVVSAAAAAVRAGCDSGN